MAHDKVPIVGEGVRFELWSDNRAKYFSVGRKGRNGDGSCEEVDFSVFLILVKASLFPVSSVGAMKAVAEGCGAWGWLCKESKLADSWANLVELGASLFNVGSRSAEFGTESEFNLGGMVCMLIGCECIKGG